jgi:hypothetical protein
MDRLGAPALLTQITNAKRTIQKEVTPADVPRDTGETVLAKCLIARRTNALAMVVSALSMEIAPKNMLITPEIH